MYVEFFHTMSALKYPAS